MNGGDRSGLRAPVSGGPHTQSKDEGVPSELDSDNDDLATGLERELAVVESPESLSSAQSAGPSLDEESELSPSSASEGDEDEDFVPHKPKSKPSRLKRIVDHEASSDSEDFTQPRRKSAAITARGK